MTHQQVRHHAAAFLIWRAGMAVNWDCTAQELALETGLHVKTVRDTCAKRGWGLVDGRARERIIGVDLYVKGQINGTFAAEADGQRSYKAPKKNRVRAV